MERTGCYRLCLIDPTWWRGPKWPKIIDQAAEHWLAKTTRLLETKGASVIANNYFTEPFEPALSVAGNEPEKDEVLKRTQQKFEAIIATIDSQWDSTDLERLRTLNYESQRDEPIRTLAQALMELLAIADTACAGMGLLEKGNDRLANSVQLTHCLANLLLTATGSLSTLAKFHGTVLPKMRTPQGGITPRSLSHHLTFHTTEVEVMWRTMPWSNHHQKTLNIIAVPFPFEVTEDNFEARSERFHSVQYFSYTATLESAKENAKIYLNNIVDLVWKEGQRLDHIHVLVFPESALSDDLYSYLKQRLYERLINSKPAADNLPDNKLYHLPLIVTGIHNGKSEEYKGEEDRPGHNEMRMATFFAGKWYDVAQRKHHRWHLNRTQLAQYWLAGKLPSDRRWFEHISVGQRRLTILAPTGWLALTSLICEDLAQLEPVSEIIRGIGPTFLMALLSDGPQLNSRWSARYASVLADDPGTAVLSLTSLGMVKRSRKLTNEMHLDEPKPTESPSQTIALWKDMIRGDQMINLTGDHKAVRLTVSAHYSEEHTLDGRSDGNNAAAFRLEGFQQLNIVDPLELLPKSASLAIESNAQPDQLAQSHIDSQNSNEIAGLSSTQPSVETKPAEGTWTDIRELTALQFVLDSLIELRGRHCTQICEWLMAAPQQQSTYPPAIQVVLKRMAGAFKNPSEYGIDAREAVWVSDTEPTDIRHTTEGIRSLFSQSILLRHLQEETSPYQYYADLYEATEKEFFAKSALYESRIYFLVPLAVMYLIHAKISDWKMNALDVPDKDDIQGIIKLRKDIRKFLIENQYKSYTENTKSTTANTDSFDSPIEKIDN